MSESIIGQEKLIDRMILVLLSNGNMLLEMLPGLAKTRAIKSLARELDCGLSRIQFTHDPPSNAFLNCTVPKTWLMMQLNF